MTPARAPRRARGAGTALATVLAAAFAFGLVVFAYRQSPVGVAVLLFRGTWGTAFGAGQVLSRATPLLFAGVAVHVALRAGLFNIGTEGQIAVGSLVAASVAARLPTSWPGAAAIAATLVAASIAGAIWAFFPALLRVRYRAPEVISTILMNRIAAAVVGVAAARGVPSLHRGATSFAPLFAVVVAVAVVAAERWTRVGREIVLVGQNAEACAAARIPARARLLQAMIGSGAIAALASSATVLGHKGPYEAGHGVGAAFGGVAVALLGRGNIAFLVLAALLFGTLAQGGIAMKAVLPSETMDVVEAVVIVAVAVRAARARSLLAEPAA